MQLERYAFEANEDFMSFNFCSNGPKGIIRKAVHYSDMGYSNGIRTYNLCFGDKVDASDLPDDTIISNNGDRDKVLATVAATTLAFMERYGQLAIRAKGSTPARTRLYQMGINANLAEVQKHFDVYGEIHGVFRLFQPGINYTAFAVRMKEVNNF